MMSLVYCFVDYTYESGVNRTSRCSFDIDNRNESVKYRKQSVSFYKKCFLSRIMTSSYTHIKAKKREKDAYRRENDERGKIEKKKVIDTDVSLNDSRTRK